MQPKTAILDIAGGIAAKAGAPRLGARLQEAHEGMGRRLDRLLQQDFPASTSGVHIPMPTIEGGKLRLAPWTKDRQAHVRQTIAYNPEAMPAVVAPIPGAEVGYLGRTAGGRGPADWRTQHRDQLSGSGSSGCPPGGAGGAGGAGRCGQGAPVAS